jgi:hypothetical protein
MHIKPDTKTSIVSDNDSRPCRTSLTQSVPWDKLKKVILDTTVVMPQYHTMMAYILNLVLFRYDNHSKLWPLFPKRNRLCYPTRRKMGEASLDIVTPALTEIKLQSSGLLMNILTGSASLVLGQGKRFNTRNYWKN